MTGRKRHVPVDTPGLLGAVMALPADVQERDAAKLLPLKAASGRTRVVFADGAYSGPPVRADSD